MAGAVGALPFAPLTPAGHRQAAHAAHRLRGERIDRVYASAARRARETADAIAAGRGLNVTVLAGLGEVELGSGEGATDPVIMARAAEALHAWVVGGDLSARVADGESGHEVVARVTAVFGTVAATHPGGSVALVGHVASLTAGLSALCGVGGRVWGAPLPHAVPFLVEWDGRRWRCPGWPGVPAPRDTMAGG